MSDSSFNQPSTDATGWGAASPRGRSRIRPRWWFLDLGRGGSFLRRHGRTLGGVAVAVVLVWLLIFFAFFGTAAQKVHEGRQQFEQAEQSQVYGGRSSGRA